MISMKKQYTTKSGYPVKILTTEGPGSHPVIGLVFLGPPKPSCKSTCVEQYANLDHALASTAKMIAGRAWCNENESELLSEYHKDCIPSVRGFLEFWDSAGIETSGRIFFYFEDKYLRCCTCWNDEDRDQSSLSLIEAPVKFLNFFGLFSES